MCVAAVREVGDELGPALPAVMFQTGPEGIPILVYLSPDDRERIEPSAVLRGRLTAFLVCAAEAEAGAAAAFRGDLSVSDAAVAFKRVRESVTSMMAEFHGAPATHIQLCLDEIAAHLERREMALEGRG